MAGNVKTNSISLGDSATATQNFVLTTGVDGTCKLARGNLGATTQDVLTIGADGTVRLPASLTPAFSALTPANKTAATATFTEMAGYSTATFDTASSFNITTGRFTPTVAGYYQFNWYADFGSNGQIASSITSSILYKNGASVWTGGTATPAAFYGQVGASTVIFMNGSTDFASVYVYHNSGSTTASFAARFSGSLIART